MKKFLLSICMMILAVCSLSAAETVLTWTKAEWTGAGSNVATLNKAGFTVTIDKKAGTTVPAFRDDNSIRCYAKAEVTVTSPTPMTKIVVEPAKDAKFRFTTFTPNAGEVAYDQTAYTITWTGNATSVTFTVGDKATMGTDGEAKSGQIRIQGFTITGEAADPNVLVAPTITPDGGTFTTGETVRVTIDCPTTGAKIQYNIDGGDAIDYPAGGFDVTKTCTIGAMAVKDAEMSDFVEAKFVFQDAIKFGLVKKITSGKKYVIVSGTNMGTALGGDYGYMKVENVTPKDGYISLVNADNAFLFTAAEGGFLMQDAQGRYYSMKGDYNSFQATAEKPATGAIWTIEPQADGTIKVTNTATKKWLQFDSQYGSFGIYPEAKGALPLFFEEGATAEGSGPVVKEVEVANLEEFYALEAGNVAIFKNTLTAVFHKGNNLIVTDASGRFALVYGKLTNTYNNGDIIPAGVRGNVATYNGMLQLKPEVETVKAGVAGTPVSPATITVAELATVTPFEHKYVLLSNVNLVLDTTDPKSKTYTATDATGSCTVYDAYYVNVENDAAIVTPDASVKYNVLGTIGQHSGKKQLSLISFTDAAGVEGTVANEVAVFGLEGGVFVAGAEGAVEVYNVYGQKVAAVVANGEATINTPAGVMIVKAGNTIAKVLVK